MRGGGRSSAEAGSCAPQELDETFFKVVARRDDRVRTVSPDDEYPFITLIKDNHQPKGGQAIIMS
jgi:hypothetical protein